MARARYSRPLNTFILILAAQSPAAAPTDDIGRIAYVGAAVLDIERGRFRPATIVTRGERIEAVVAAGKRLPPGARRVEVDGLYAVPGLIDVHQHVAIGQGQRAGEALLRRELFSGVTAIRDMGGDARLLRRLARAGRSGQIPAPDILYSAVIAGPGFFERDRRMDEAAGGKAGRVPWNQQIGPGTDLRPVVAAARSTGATGLKLYANLDAANLGALVREGRRQRMPIWSHSAIFPATPLQVARSGVQSVSHICMIAYQAVPVAPSSTYHDRPTLDEAPLLSVRPHPGVEAVFRALKEKRTIIDTTLLVYPTIERMRARLGPERGPPIYCSSRLAQHLAGQAHRAGVKLAAGTDAFTDGPTSYPGIFDELILLRDGAGLPPIQALRAATVNAAEAIGARHHMGTLTPGALANIAFFASDPLHPRADLKSVRLTVKRGRAYWRRDYVPVTAEELRR